MISTALTLTLCAVPFAAQAENRAAHAHEHGASNLSIALDGTALALTLEAPAHDILGFETPPTDETQRAALAQLNDPIALFGLDPAAACALQSANVTPMGYDTASADGHAEFEASYQIICQTAPTGMTATFFTAFSHAESLDVDIISPSSAAEVMLTAQSPSLFFPASQSPCSPALPPKTSPFHGPRAALGWR